MNQDLFLTEDAERFFKASSGKPYRPSNGAEGEMFMSAFCAHCVHDAAHRANPHGADGCPIIPNSMAYDISDPNYPPEWRWSERGQPVCLAFDQAHGGE